MRHKHARRFRRRQIDSQRTHAQNTKNLSTNPKNRLNINALEYGRLSQTIHDRRDSMKNTISEDQEGTFEATSTARRVHTINDGRNSQPAYVVLQLRSASATFDDDCTSRGPRPRDGRRGSRLKGGGGGGTMCIVRRSPYLLLSLLRYHNFTPLRVPRPAN